ncbi:MULTISPECIES: hypothetical protein [unclassified Bradyrhizobium]|uniref:hypothetical protein n=1 Tax=unclassified Bradyrhizobium TaxID=2631580 RepID=UPI002916692F|nr:MULTISPECIES: hypothetical protein [unclassified Bradyrhizobium]
MTDLESLVVEAAKKQGYGATADAIRQAAVDLAGAVLTPQGLIMVPGKGALAPADYARALLEAMPTAFKPLDARQPDDRPSGNVTMTEQMRSAVTASRRQALPGDFNAVRERYAAGTVTRAHMDAVAASRRQGK